MPRLTTDRVPLAPFQEHCLRRVREGESWSELAARCGYLRDQESCRTGRSGDTSALKRRLGLLPNTPRAGYAATITTALKYDTAVRLCRALDLDPVDVGV